MAWLDAVRALAGSERDLAERAHARQRHRFAAKVRRREQLLRGDRDDAVILGRVLRGTDSWDWFSLDRDRLTSMHASIAGATGSGKTRWVEAVLSQLIGSKDLNLVLIDAKSELSDDLLEVVLPHYVASTGDTSILERLRIIRPFGPHTPPLNITLPEPGISREAQAIAIVSSIEEALDEQFGARMRITLPQLVSCAIALKRPLTAILDWLLDPRALLKEIIRCPDPELRSFAQTGLPRENPETLKALAARIRAVLFLPETRRALSTSECISSSDVLNEPGAITIVDVGSPPAGNERLLRFYGGLVFGRFVRALLSRSVTAASPRVVLLCEEVQEILGTNEARSLTRLLSLARFRKAAIWTTNQSRAQLLAVDRSLDQALRVNTGINLQMRASLEDAKAFAHLLPRTKSESGKTGSRLRAVEALTLLPQRRGYLALRTENLTVSLHSPRFDLDAMRAATPGLSDEIREQIRRGIHVGKPLELPEPSRSSVSVFTKPPLEDSLQSEPSEFPALG